ncbi:MAG: DUF2304 domain-containing protein [Lachnospiraceae bacterium]|nr:DUF2304 domain-containing protein [Lachnospiraceae bacterium]
MTVSLRIVLIAFSLITAIFVFRKIRKSQMQIVDSLFWILFIGMLVLLSVFPRIADYACKWLGVMSPVNFVFLAIIFLLLLKVFGLSVKISFLENKLQNLVQQYAIDRNIEREKNE